MESAWFGTCQRFVVDEGQLVGVDGAAVEAKALAALRKLAT